MSALEKMDADLAAFGDLKRAASLNLEHASKEPRNDNDQPRPDPQGTPKNPQQAARHGVDFPLASRPGGRD